MIMNIDNEGSQSNVEQHARQPISLLFNFTKKNLHKILLLNHKLKKELL